uniref:Major facilitator superfamily (MFS) profile domain-containing protein n=1 Tax=Strigamia maritima TaxID=126957 RepID=T1J985_STRMM
MARKNLDDFLSEFGNPGRCQLLYSLIIIFIMMQWAMLQGFNIVMTYIPEHRCKYPSLLQSDNFTILNTSKCTVSRSNFMTNVDEVINCPNGWNYTTLKGEIYPSNEFNLVCHRQHLFRFALTIPYVGVMIGGLLFGYLSDKFLPESVTWLMSQSKLNETERVLTKFSKYNNISISPTIRQDIEEQIQDMQHRYSGSSSFDNTKKLFSNGTLRKIMFSSMYLMFINATVNNGLSFSLSALKGNVYNNYLINAGIQIFIMAIFLALFTKFGRVKILIALFFSSGVLCAVGFNILYYTPDLDVLQNIGIYMAFVSRNLAYACTSMISTYISELLPTFLRSSGLGISFTIYRLGSTVTPEILYRLNHIWQPLPQTLYGIWQMVAVAVLCILPETFNRFTNYLVIGGLSFSISALEGSVYTNYLINSILQIFILAIGLALFNRFGRIRIFIILFASSGLLCAGGYILIFYSKNWYQWIQLLALFMALVSRNITSAIAGMLSTYAAELLPTFLRSTGLGVYSTASRFGSILTPQILYTLNHVWEPLPQTLYGALMLIAVIVIWFLPETFSRSMPHSLADVDKIREKSQDEEKTPLLRETK